MTVAIMVAPATRIGYLLYPVDFFIFSWLLRSEDLGSPMLALDEPLLEEPAWDGGGAARGPAPIRPGEEPVRQLNVTANSLTVNDVDSWTSAPDPKVVGATVTPISHS